VRIYCDFRLPCPKCEEGAIRMLVTPGKSEGHVCVSVMHNMPDCAGSDGLTSHEVLDRIAEMVKQLHEVEIDA